MKNVARDIFGALRQSLDWLLVLALLLLLAPNAHAQQISTGRATTAAPTYTNATAAPLSLDLSGNLRTNCVSGCAGGSFNNNADGVATSATNGQAAAWLYGFNGATWDRARADTTAGLWVQLKAALPAGAAIIGKVGIDQTTPGTTNGVQVNAALPAGSNIIGNIRIDQTTPGTTNGVQITGGSLAANQSVNVAQINGVTPLMGAGNTGTGSHRVTQATDQAALAAWGHGATGSAVPAGATLAGVSKSTGGTLAAISADPCMTSARTHAPISIASATTTRIIAPSASNRTYICGLFLYPGAANNVGIVEGTGGTCGTGTAGVIGGTTAATGIVATATAGFALPVTGYAQAATAGTNVDFCLITSGAGQLSGNVVYVQQP